MFPIDRRSFLSRAGAGAAGSLAAALPAFSKTPPAAAQLQSGVRITRISRFTLESKRWKNIGKNSRRDVHGWIARDPIIRIETDAGLEGIGVDRNIEKNIWAELLNTDPLAWYTPGRGVVSPCGSADAALWDLVGKVLEQPVWRLLGGYGDEWTPVYDGSIYFSDLDPEFAGRGIDRILEEVNYALEQGHRAFKIKVGRGAKWMERDAGFRRDVAVVRAIRTETGPDVQLMVDANNGMDPTITRRFLEAIEDDLLFVEEMFPENVQEDLALKSWLRDHGNTTLVADGESARDVDHFTPYIKAKALDVLQGDIRRFGFTRLQTLARNAAPAGVRLAPHNWGSFLGGYMQVVLARGIPNFLRAEIDPAQNDLIDVSAFEWKDDRILAPDVPGCGWTLRVAEAEKQFSYDWIVS